MFQAAELSDDGGQGRGDDRLIQRGQEGDQQQGDEDPPEPGAGAEEVSSNAAETGTSGGDKGESGAPGRAAAEGTGAGGEVKGRALSCARASGMTGG